MLRQQPPSVMHHGSAVSRFMVAAVLLLLSCPRSLLAQNGTNNGAALCFLQMLSCMLTSDVDGGADCYFAAMSCVEGLPPDPPPAPPGAKPPSDDDACYGGEAVRGPAQARVAVSLLRPHESQSCSASITTVDPVPDLLERDQLISDWDFLANNGNPVGSIAADSAARVVMRIPACKAGQVFNVTLKADDQQGSQGLGTLSTVNGSENATQLNVTAVKLEDGEAMAFAVYNAPPDFSRGGNDDTAYSRTIDITAVSTHPKATSCGGMTILRPPLVLVHGLWADDGAWDDFVAGNSAILGAYFVRRAGYALPFTLEANAPLTPDTYPPALRDRWSGWWSNLRANSLGLATTAPMVGAEIQGFIQEFKNAQGAAAIQADVIGHSMGGLVTRTLVKSPDFTQFQTFGKGYVHKLITIGTPHQGSPLATALGTESDNSCTRNVMALAGNVSIDAVSLGGEVVDGAILDLIPGNQNVSSGSHSVPTGMIGGSASAANLIGLDRSSRPAWLRRFCSNGLLTFDSLPLFMTSARWPLLMGAGSDGIVPLSSEFNGASAAPDGTAAVPGIVHSRGAVTLGLIGPIELDLGGSMAGVGDQLSKLLNAPVAGNKFQMLP